MLLWDKNYVYFVVMKKKVAKTSGCSDPSVDVIVDDWRAVRLSWYVE